MKPHLLRQVQLFEIDNPLLAHARNVHSQNGEDGILEHIFSVLPGHGAERYCVEFGGWDGRHLSNCCSLIENHGWSGCFIEADERKFGELLANHGANERVRCIRRFVEFEGPDSLDSILAAAGAPADLDLLSIDVDGIDYFIWEGLQRHRPKLVVIEFNPSIPNDVIFVQPKDNRVNQGCSLLALIVLAKMKGYELLCCTSVNAFFVRAELYPAFGLRSNSIHHMRRHDGDGRIFHGYDSYVYVAGMPRLYWSNTEVGSEDFQVLPAALRRFGSAPARPG